MKKLKYAKYLDADIRKYAAFIPTNRQAELLSVRNSVRELLTWGNRMGGKSDYLIWDFLSDVGEGHGNGYKGLFYRRRYKQLADMKSRFREAIVKKDPKAKYNGKDEIWRFSTGEELHFGHFDRIQDLMRSHGFAYQWIGIDELCEFEDDKIYKRMKGICRPTSSENVFCRIRSATNTYGPGNPWVRHYFEATNDYDPPKYSYVKREDGTKERVYKWAARMDYRDNPHAVKKDPTYMDRLRQDNADDPDIIASWVDSSWDVTSQGAMFHSVWDKQYHFIEPFEIPKKWRIYRSMDWGTYHPYAVLFIAVSDGSPVYYKGVDGKVTHVRKTRRNDMFVIDEMYGMLPGRFNVGTNETARQVAKQIRVKCAEIKKKYGITVRSGPADWDVFKEDGRNTNLHQEFLKEGIKWKKAVKGRGSRVSSLDKFKNMLICAKRQGMSGPGIYVFNICYHFIRTVPNLQRDELNPSDVDTRGEDHIYDAKRMFLLWFNKGRRVKKMNQPRR